MQTSYTGDILQGKKVISCLNTEDLENGTTHELYFQTEGQNITGQHYYVPVSVIKGAQTGPRIVLTAGLHANEMNPYPTVNDIKSKLDPKTLKGTVLIVHQYNISGLIANIREFVPSGPVKVHENINRQASTPKRETAGQLYCSSMWEKLVSKNADWAVDYHTANPTTFPLFAYSNMSLPKVATMTNLFGVDVVLNSHTSTTLSGSFTDMGIPAFTLEVGARDIYEGELVERSVQGTLNFLRYLKMIPGDIIDFPPAIFTNEWVLIRSEFGACVKAMVKLMDTVKKDDVLYLQYDAFGNKIKEYLSPHDGVIVQINQCPIVESGTMIAALVYHNTDKAIDADLEIGGVGPKVKI